MTEPKSYIEDGIEYVECATARQFLDYLQIRNERWLPADATSSPWVFRGHADASWKLEPSALREKTTWFDQYKSLERENVRLLFENSNIQYHDLDYRPSTRILQELVLQVAAERYAVDEFVKLADQVGHPIPDDFALMLGEDELTLKNVLNELLDSRLNKTPQSKYSYHFYPRFIKYALAQHHGIPTRLLDWTISPFVAAFIAAEDALKPKTEKIVEICVWAINRDYLPKAELEIVTHRRGKLSYLHAQGGLFIYDKNSNRYFIENGKWRQLEQILGKTTALAGRPIIQKIILSVGEAKELLRLLAVENITRAHLMPTYDNITETLKMQQPINKSLE